LCWLDFSSAYSDETLEARERHLVISFRDAVGDPVWILFYSSLNPGVVVEDDCLTTGCLRAFKERWFVANIVLRGPGNKVYRTVIPMVFENTLFVRLYLRFYCVRVLFHFIAWRRLVCCFELYYFMYYRVLILVKRFMKWLLWSYLCILVPWVINRVVNWF